MQKCCLFSLVGQWAPIHPVWALAAIHPEWGNRYFLLNKCERPCRHKCQRAQNRAQHPSSNWHARYVLCIRLALWEPLTPPTTCVDFCWKPRNPDFGDLEIQKFGIQKMKKIKSLKTQIRSAQNAGKVWISRKKSSWPYLGASEAIFSIGRKNPKMLKVCLFSLVGQGALFTRSGLPLELLLFKYRLPHNNHSKPCFH